MNIRYIIVFLASFLFFDSASANNGQLAFTNDTVCNASTEGAMVYRDDSSSFLSCLENSPGVFNWFRVVNGGYVPATPGNNGIALTADTLCTVASEGALRYNSTLRSFEGCVQTGAATYAWMATPVVIEDTTPTAISFTTQTGLNLNTMTISNTVTLSGFTTNTAATCNICELAKNGVWSGGGTLNGLVPGDTITARMNSSTSYSTTVTAAITVGGGLPYTWQIATRAKDDTPNALTLTNQTAVNINTVVDGSFTPTGFDGPITVSCTGCTLLVGGQVRASPYNNLNPGDAVIFRVTSSGSYETTTSIPYTVGTLSGTWSVTTQDITPNAFTFTNQTNVEPNTLITSNAVTLSGFNGTLTATCSACSAIARNGVWGSTSVSGFTSGDTIAIRLTSINNYNTQNGSTVTVGNTVSTQWTVTTRLRDTTPDGFSFTNQNNLTRITQVTSNTISVSGFEGTVTASTSGGSGTQLNINGGGWVSSGNISSGNTLAVRTTTSGSYGTGTTVTITVGGTSTNWTATTGTVAYGAWQGWGGCSASCGGGTQTNNRTCNFSGGGTVSCSDCGGFCTDTQSCNTQACYTYDWATGGWGGCDVSCGDGNQYRAVWCRRSDGASVGDGFCSGPKPSGAEGCYAGDCCHSQTGGSCVKTNDNWCGSSAPWACSLWYANTASCEVYRGGTITSCSDVSQTICCHLTTYGTRQCDGSCL